MKNSSENTKKIYIGIDVHTTNYNISFYDPETNQYKYESRLKADDCVLVQYINRMIKRHYSNEDCVFEVGYEAGYTGFNTYRFLREHGITCKVLAPNTIKRSPKQKKFKNDIFDARLIAKTLANQDYSKVYVPTPEDESVKRLLSLRDMFTKELTQVKNKIKAHVQQKNLKPDKNISKNWSKDYLDFLILCEAEEKLPEDKMTLEMLLEEYFRLNERIELIDKQLAEVAQRDKYRENVRNLCAFKGVGVLTALSVILTVGDINRFESPKQFANYLGLTPGLHSSAESENHLGITKSGNKRLRKLLILAAQSYSRGNAYYKTKPLLKKQEGLAPEIIQYADKASKRLHKKFNHMRKDLYKSHNKTVCAVARELANFIWGMLSGNID